MFDSAKFEFTRDEVHAEVLPRGEHGLSHVINVIFSHLEQVSSIAQIFNFLNQISSTIEHLTLKHEVHNQSSEEEEHNEVDPTEWHKLRRSFTNAKSLRIDDCLVEELSCSLRVDDGEHRLGLSPELQELRLSGSGNTSDVFIPFIDARHLAGCPVTIIPTYKPHPSPRSVTPVSHN